MNPLLGWIAPQNRNKEQWDAHDLALQKRCSFGLVRPTVPKGTKVILTDAWKDPLCVSDMGREFTGFRQLTGSCVGASDGTAVTTLSCVQRKLATNPTKAVIIWWPAPYGWTRQAEGDRGQGEGAVDSVMGETIGTKGVFSINEPGLPSFDTSDGFALTSSIELQWSDGAAIPSKWLAVAKPNVVGGRTSLATPDDIAAAILNGYPVLDGCDNYMAHGSIKGSGDTAYVVGHYDGRGGHSTCYLGYWEHPNDGPLFLYSNNWDGSTYPKDPAGAGRCCVWTPESEVVKLFQNGGSNGETMALSHLNYLPAQPNVLNCFV